MFGKVIFVYAKCNYTVEMSTAARKNLRKLDAPIRNRITKWIEDNIVDCENPRAHGKNWKEYPNANWRYRVGDYRIFVDIQDDKIVIMVVKIDKRNDVYK